MNIASPPTPTGGRKWIGILAAGVLVLIVLGTKNLWWPGLNRMLDRVVGKGAAGSGEAHDAHGHGAEPHDDHGHAGHDTANSLELSPQARKNLGLNSDYLRPIALSTFRKTISIPALVAERPGRTQIVVSTPMTGVVTDVAAVQGAAVEPGALLFRIRLTHEDLVQSQTDFVRTLGELDVEGREVARLKSVAESGAVAGKTLLERQYSKEKLEALLGAQREALRLHGLSDRQIEQISRDRRLLSELRIVAPGVDGESRTDELQLTDRLDGSSVAFFAGDLPRAGQSSPAGGTHPLVVERLDVQRGQSIEQGGRLCSLADYSRLYIEGRAFELDSGAINAAAEKGWTVAAAFPDGSMVESLPLEFIAGEVDPESRTLRFYVDLVNEVIRDRTTPDGRRFIVWKYRPGQRLQIRVPVEEWNDQIVLPVDAVAQEGPESFVFQQNGKHFDRISVHVLYRDQSSVVIANDGSVFPGSVVAYRGAHQMQMALKNQAGGGIDPHAGHNH